MARISIFGILLPQQYNMQDELQTGCILTFLELQCDIYKLSLNIISIFYWLDFHEVNYNLFQQTFQTPDIFRLYQAFPTSQFQRPCAFLQTRRTQCYKLGQCTEDLWQFIKFLCREFHIFRLLSYFIKQLIYLYSYESFA